MKCKILVLVTFLIIPFSAIFTQNIMEFVDVKDADGLKTVYFQVKGLNEDDAARATLMKDLLADPNVIKGRIFTSSSLKTRCQLFLPYEISPEYIRPILQSHGYDFEFSSVSIDGKLLIDKNAKAARADFYSPTDDFPQYVSTGDKILDAENYRIAKEQWIENNKRKYKKQKSNGTAKYPIVISQEQFDSYTEDKQQKILAQPDIFEINQY
ncbi:MAG: hypothetical protein PHP52_10015 [Bacteroidales bacterium]|nr:hypothetical protein [Bacteroidales bacterium]MDD4215839.1 hypothetical protein [Bacteroidales bacterium]MDY0141983.1 hypothetical protein [Bacteroidales bacterium]